MRHVVGLSLQLDSPLVGIMVSVDQNATVDTFQAAHTTRHHGSGLRSE